MINLKTGQKLILAYTVFMTSFFALILASLSFIPGEFLYIEIGRFLGPIISFILVSLILILTLLVPGRFLSRFKDSMTKNEYSAFLKKKRKKITALSLLSLSISLLILSIFSYAFISIAKERGNEIDQFVAQNADESIEDYVANLTIFLNSNLKSCYNKPEVMFKADQFISYHPLGSWILDASGISRADIILYQGWGTCGQAAILLQQVMHDSGYETRRGHFKGIDHEWAEVKTNGTWVIIDPWYIGNLVDIQTLKNAKPDFQRATGVEVNFYNGTICDASKEHGY